MLLRGLFLIVPVGLQVYAALLRRGIEAWQAARPVEASKSFDHEKFDTVTVVPERTRTFDDVEKDLGELGTLLREFTVRGPGLNKPITHRIYTILRGNEDSIIPKLAIKGDNFVFGGPRLNDNKQYMLEIDQSMSDDFKTKYAKSRRGIRVPGDLAGMADSGPNHAWETGLSEHGNNIGYIISPYPQEWNQETIEGVLKHASNWAKRGWFIHGINQHTYILWSDRSQPGWKTNRKYVMEDIVRLMPMRVGPKDHQNFLDPETWAEWGSNKLKALITPWSIPSQKSGPFEVKTPGRG